MRYFIIAAEESAEIYGARLVKEIKKKDDYATFEGIGGDRMQKEGVKLMYQAHELALIGVVDIFKKIFFVRRVLGEIKARLKKGEIDAIILLDAPELNFRVGKFAHSVGIPVFYYVCPQLWAWRSYRAKSLRKWVDTALVIFPFEEEFYKEYGVRTKFVGHPMLDEITPDVNRETLRADLMHSNTKKLIGLMPGSRMSEVRAILDPLIEVADLIRAKRPDVSFVIPVAPHMPQAEILASVGPRDFIKVIKGGSHKVMAANDFLITKSGTSTLEAAIIGTPMIIVYKTASLSYIIPRLMANVRFAGLPNLIADREIAIEYLQRDFKPEYVAETALELLGNQLTLEKKRHEMEEVKKSLGEPGAGERAAEYIIERVKEIDNE